MIKWSTSLSVEECYEHFPPGTLFLDNYLSRKFGDVHLLVGWYEYLDERSKFTRARIISICNGMVFDKELYQCSMITLEDYANNFLIITR